MIQLPRVGWRLLDCSNGASSDWIFVVVKAWGCVVCCVVIVSLCSRVCADRNTPTPHRAFTLRIRNLAWLSLFCVT